MKKALVAAKDLPIISVTELTNQYATINDSSLSGKKLGSCVLGEASDGTVNIYVAQGGTPSASWSELSGGSSADADIWMVDSYGYIKPDGLNYLEVPTIYTTTQLYSNALVSGANVEARTNLAIPSYPNVTSTLSALSTRITSLEAAPNNFWVTSGDYLEAMYNLPVKITGLEVEKDDVVCTINEDGLRITGAVYSDGSVRASQLKLSNSTFAEQVGTVLHISNASTGSTVFKTNSGAKLYHEKGTTQYEIYTEYNMPTAASIAVQTASVMAMSDDGEGEEQIVATQSVLDVLISLQDSIDSLKNTITSLKSEDTKLKNRVAVLEAQVVALQPIEDEPEEEPTE